MNTDRLLHIADNDFWNKINNQFQDNGGVYKIIAVQDGQRITIKRFLGYDKNGILYIGKANSFLDRVIDLKKSISPEYQGTSHICGRRYKSNPNIARQFPFSILFIELIHSDKPDELEKDLLNDYRLVYGEVPPLNAI